MARVLVTGGAGYIGSHTVVQLLEAGHEVVVFDDLSNSSELAIERVAQITGRGAELVVGDITDAAAMNAVFAGHDFDSVIHFAGLKAVGESVSQPLRYYRTNVGGTITLLEAMDRHGVHDIVFSSSATVYGDPKAVPVDETAPTSTTNPYGATKLMIEDILGDLRASDDRWSIALLRYFNPVGAHESGLIGEAPDDIPNNLMPMITQVAVRNQPFLKVFGNDYPTPDGTGVRDYIHVVDLAAGHLDALGRIAADRDVHTWNLGTGHGTSVMEMIAAFESAAGREIPYEVTSRRPGDVATVFADPSKAERELGWKATRTVEDMCRDAWRWQERNPDGYGR